MGIFLELVNSFMRQGVIGWIVIFLIIGICIADIFISMKSKEFYKKLNDDFEQGRVINEKGEREFSNDILTTISEEFKKSASNGVDNINTQALIMREFEVKKKLNDGILTILPATAIALGLLGTFLGLTIAIYSTNGVLESGIKTMEIFLDKMAIPLQGMSSAFWTSIFGVIVSVILNNVNLISKREKEKFYDTIENYLDNILYGEYSYSFVAQFEKFNNTISESMLNLTKDMRELFKEGVNELVNNINKNTLDMTDTTKELTRYAEDFGRVINSLGETIGSFNEPVERFKTSIDEFKITTEKLEFIMNSSVDRVADKVELLGVTITNLGESIDGKNDIFYESVEEIKKNREELEVVYKTLVGSIDNVNRNLESRDRDLYSEISKLNMGYENFKVVLVEFVDRVGHLEEKMSEGLVESVEKGLFCVSNEITSNIKGILLELETSISELASNTQTIGRLVRATNEWVDVKRR